MFCIVDFKESSIHKAAVRIIIMEHGEFMCRTINYYVYTDLAA